MDFERLHGYIIGNVLLALDVRTLFSSFRRDSSYREKMEHDLAALQFVPDLYKISNHGDDRIAWIPLKIPDRQTLFNVLAHDLDFPQYFGQNWDASYDLLCDLSWISQRRVVIIHEDLPFQLTEKELRTYLELLIDVVKCWGPKENHELAVIFPLSSQKKVKIG